MTRQELIGYVQTKLDEKSPFEEPTSLVVAEGDPAYDVVKPTKVYIEDLLDAAANDCLRILPLSLLANDVEKYTEANAVVNNDGVCEQSFSSMGINGYARFVRVSVDCWEKDVVAFITSADALYLKQQNKSVRGKLCKPIVAIVPEKSCIELYSFPGMENSSNKTGALSVYHIKCDKTAGSDSVNPVLSNIEEFIAIRCAELVSNVFGTAAQSQIFQKEFAEKAQSIMV